MIEYPKDAKCPLCQEPIEQYEGIPNASKVSSNVFIPTLYRSVHTITNSEGEAIVTCDAC
jgi:hypothetical protein